MKEIETAEQVCQGHGLVDEVGGADTSVVAAMEEYATQFQPQWIKINSDSDLPKVGDEFNVVMDLQDGLGGPVSSTLEWDAINRLWVYPGTDTQVEHVTHWMPLPQPPK